MSDRDTGDKDIQGSLSKMSSNAASSSNASGAAAAAASASTTTLHDGFLAPPVWQMVAGLKTPEEIVERATRLSEAYLLHCIFTAFPSPRCPLPPSITDLLKEFEPASPEHFIQIHMSLHYIVKSESFFWTDLKGKLAPFDSYLNPQTRNALCALMSHWDEKCVKSRLYQKTHDHLIERDLDTDPTPPQPLGHYVLQRSLSTAPGEDRFLYEGSYCQAIEKMLGRTSGTYSIVAFGYEGGAPGFLRDVGTHLLFPALQSELEKTVALYQSHPVACLARALNHLGLPRIDYVLVPPVQADLVPTAEELEIAERWVQRLKRTGGGVRLAIMDLLQGVVKSYEALQSDSRATLIMMAASAIESEGGLSLTPDVIAYMSTFAGTRLPDNAPEFQIRQRPTCFSDAAMTARGVQVRLAAAAAAAETV